MCVELPGWDARMASCKESLDFLLEELSELNMDIQSFWNDVLSQNARALPHYFVDDAVIRWHCSNEQFTVAEYIQANCEYPGEWDGQIERAEQYGEQLVTVVNVFTKDRSASFHVVSFMKLQNGKIAALDEYWADDGQAPEWRKAMQIGRPIR